MANENRIFIVDVTNRDGVQTSRICLSKLAKTIVNLQLNEMGIRQSEFGFPTTRHESHYLNANLELAEMGVLSPIVLEGWIRAVPEDVELALKLTRVRHLNLSISTSDQMIKNKFKGKLDRDSIIREMTEASQLARSRGILTLGVNAEDASRTDLDYLIRFARAAKEAGADRFRYCDTLGYDDPFTTHDRISAVARAVGIAVEMHCHNDLGMAVANSVAGARAALDAGVDCYINTTVNGVGERAGNADLLSILLALRKASGLQGRYGPALQPIDLKKVWRLAKYTSWAFGIPIPINQVGVGSNAFAHESGIHADGALKDRHNYELYDFEELGRGEPDVIETGRMITTGEYGGIHGFRDVYGRLKIEFRDNAEATRVLELARHANIHTQKPLVEDELRFIAAYPEQACKILTMTPLAEDEPAWSPAHVETAHAVHA
jgi:isopropylmalate/homocitrate/citramalate synthase